MDARRSPWGVLDSITSPVLVAGGADSNIFSDDDAEGLAIALLEGQWLAVPRARHSIQTDNSDGPAAAVFRLADSLVAH